MPNTSAPSLDFKSLVASQFSSRPTLRQVASKRIMALLHEYYPLLASYRPELTDADRLKVATPPADGGLVKVRPLVDVVLQAHLDHTVLDFAPLGIYPQFLMLDQKRFFVNPDPFASAPGDKIELETLTQPLNELVLALYVYFSQALIDYWRAPGSVGVSRDRWLQQTIKSALLQNLPLQGLDAQQQACVLGLLQGGEKRPSMYLLQLESTAHGQTTQSFLSDLFIYGSWDQQETVLWCKPSGVIWAYRGFDELGLALQREHGEQTGYDSLVWHRHELEGDPFPQLTAMLQECMLQNVLNLWRLPLASIADLEQACHACTEPAQWFIEGYAAQPDVKGSLPPWLSSLPARDSFAYQVGLFELALAQAESGGIGALDGVLNLYDYASQRLRRELLADHPVDANYFPDDLQLELTSAVGVPGGAAIGTGDGVVTRRSVSLTEFAIANLSSLQGATITAIFHRDRQLIMDWLTADYVKALVTRVDIGRNYPAYVAEQLNEPKGLEQRVIRFGREWRCSFLLSALQAKRDGKLGDASLQAICDYCAGHIDTDLPASMLMPFALRREPLGKDYDLVRGMYVLFNASAGCVVLYRPLYGEAAIREFDTIGSMMKAVRSETSLQTSMLDWMSPQVRPVYAHGGFSEPHLGRPIVDTSILPAPVSPAQFWPRYWRTEVDLQLYAANRDLLVELAERNSVSNAESRWAILTRGAWLLFDVATLLLRGPVASAAWLVQMFSVASADIQAIRDGSPFERSAAVVDMLLNLVMVVSHAHAPRPVTGAAVDRRPAAAWPEGLVPEPVIPSGTQAASLKPGEVYLPGSPGMTQTLLDFSFVGGEGFNVLPIEQRKALEAMRSAVVLDGVVPETTGLAAGLYHHGGEYYAALRGDNYRVAVDEQGVRIIDAHGKPGPWLQEVNGAWRIDGGQRLLGGMPKSRVQKQREANSAQEEKIREMDREMVEQRRPLSDTYKMHFDKVEETTTKIESLQQAGGREEELSLQLQLRRAQRQYLLNDTKALIDHDIAHEEILKQLGAVRLSSADMTQALAEQRSIIREGVVATCEYRYNLLATMINEEDIASQRNAIAVLPETEEEIQQYRRLVDSLERVRKWGADLVSLAAQFDPLLESTLNDNDIVFRDNNGRVTNKHAELGLIIRQRRLNAVDLEFRLLENLGELSLDRLKGTSEAQVADYDERLVGAALRSAGSAHGDLASSISDEERGAVLSDVINAYEESIGRAEYLASSQPIEIRLDKLELFLQVLRKLKSRAVEELSAIEREQASVEVRPQRTPVYAPRGGTRRVVKTHQGHNVVGVESVDNDGVAVVQQKDSYDNVIRTFRRQNSQWQEVGALDREEPAPIPTPLPKVLRRRIRELIGKVDDTVKTAQRFLSNDEPLGFATIIDQHVADLEKALSYLPRSGTDADLAATGNTAIRRLENTKAEFLKAYYLTTKTPTLNALKFLHRAGEISILRSERRVQLSVADYLDVYEVKRISGGPLWEAHFHYPAENSTDRDFLRGHLKLWSQRKLGLQAQLRAARRNEVLNIYRGQLRAEDVEGIIPFT
ncbi:dermonecrotic toxin domain-containing protein [Pseudomonas laurentiana]